MEKLPRFSLYIAATLEIIWIAALLFAVGTGNITRSLLLFLFLLFLPLAATAVALAGFFAHHKKPILFVILAGIIEFAMILLVAIVAIGLGSLQLT
ncbi:hypothetical protein HYX70_02555 [Candidatus Saccharibacteria bacterium]|nr:hypothetical protein [Candidatus Saccharibacteria bacterium]